MIRPELLIAQAAGTGGGGIDPVIFMFIVGGLSSALAGLAAILWRRVERENDDLRKDNRDLRERLAKYEDLSPDLLNALEAMGSQQDHEPRDQDGPDRTRREARLPYPYRSHHPSSRGPKRQK